MAGQLRRYPGARSFRDDATERMLFFGRTRDAERLLHQVLSERLVVVYGKSGAGKTSLLNCGLFASLRERSHLPIVARVNGVEGRLADSVFEATDRIVADRGYELDGGPLDRRSLWHFFKSLEIWDGATPITPVLVLDQFEELFTLQTAEAREAFITELSDLVRGRMPRGEGFDAGADEARYGTDPPELRVVMSLREDFLGQLDELSASLPNILRVVVKVEPLTVEQAEAAIEGPAALEADDLDTPPFRFEESARDALLRFLSQTRATTLRHRFVEPFQLQLVCQHVERAVLARVERGEPAVARMAEVGGEDGLRRVVADFYADEIARVPRSLRPRVERLFERGFVSPQGRRLLLERGDIEARFGVDETVLRGLVDARLLNSEPRPQAGTTNYELSHDTLVEPVRRDAARRSARRNLRLGVAAGTLIALAGLFTFDLLRDQREAEYLAGVDARVANLVEQDRMDALLIAVDALARSEDLDGDQVHPGVVRGLMTAVDGIDERLELAADPPDTLGTCPEQLVTLRRDEDGLHLVRAGGVGELRLGARPAPVELRCGGPTENVVGIASGPATERRIEVVDIRDGAVPVAVDASGDAPWAVGGERLAELRADPPGLRVVASGVEATLSLAGPPRAVELSVDGAHAAVLLADSVQLASTTATPSLLGAPIRRPVAEVTWSLLEDDALVVVADEFGFAVPAREPDGGESFDRLRDRRLPLRAARDSGAAAVLPLPAFGSVLALEAGSAVLFTAAEEQFRLVSSDEVTALAAGPGGTALLGTGAGALLRLTAAQLRAPRAGMAPEPLGAVDAGPTGFSARGAVAALAWAGEDAELQVVTVTDDWTVRVRRPAPAEAAGPGPAAAATSQGLDCPVAMMPAFAPARVLLDPVVRQGGRELLVLDTDGGMHRWRFGVDGEGSCVSAPVDLPIMDLRVEPELRGGRLLWQVADGRILSAELGSDGEPLSVEAPAGHALARLWRGGDEQGKDGAPDVRALTVGGEVLRLGAPSPRLLRLAHRPTALAADPEHPGAFWVGWSDGSVGRYGMVRAVSDEASGDLVVQPRAERVALLEAGTDRVVALTPPAAPPIAYAVLDADDGYLAVVDGAGLLRRHDIAALRCDGPRDGPPAAPAVLEPALAATLASALAVCPFEADGRCDAPGLCPVGTDLRDCALAAGVDGPIDAPGADSCRWALDGACDEPGLCAAGTDTTDCGARTAEALCGAIPVSADACAATVAEAAGAPETLRAEVCSLDEGRLVGVVSLPGVGPSDYLFDAERDELRVRSGGGSWSGSGIFRFAASEGVPLERSPERIFPTSAGVLVDDGRGLKRRTGNAWEPVAGAAAVPGARYTVDSVGRMRLATDAGTLVRPARVASAAAHRDVSGVFGDGARIAASAQEVVLAAGGRVERFDARTLETLGADAGFCSSGTLTDLAFSPDGLRLAGACMGLVQVRVPGVPGVEGPRLDGDRLAWSGDGELLVSGGGAVLDFWRFDVGRGGRVLVDALQDEPIAVTALAVLDPVRAVVGTEGGVLLLCDLAARDCEDLGAPFGETAIVAIAVNDGGVDVGWRTGEVERWTRGEFLAGAAPEHAVEIEIGRRPRVDRIERGSGRRVVLDGRGEIALYDDAGNFLGNGGIASALGLEAVAAAACSRLLPGLRFGARTAALPPGVEDVDRALRRCVAAAPEGELAQAVRYGRPVDAAGAPATAVRAAVDLALELDDPVALERLLPAVTEAFGGLDEVLLQAAVGAPRSVRSLLAAGAAADTRDVDGWTPLMIATQRERPAIVEALLAAGADHAEAGPVRSVRAAAGDRARVRLDLTDRLVDGALAARVRSLMLGGPGALGDDSAAETVLGELRAQAAEDTDARLVLAELLWCCGEAAARDEARAIHLALADAGEGGGWLGLSRYEDGPVGGEVLARALASPGSRAAARTELARRLLAPGPGPEEDDERATVALRLAVAAALDPEFPDTAGAVLAGRLLLEGPDAHRDAGRAYALLMAAAQAGDPRAMVDLADWHVRVSGNLAEARAWLDLAAERGLGAASRAAATATLAAGGADVAAVGESIATAVRRNDTAALPMAIWWGARNGAPVLELQRLERYLRAAAGDRGGAAAPVPEPPRTMTR
jgi:hypothetical protein